MRLLAGAKNQKNCGQNQDRRGPPPHARSPRQSRKETESLHERQPKWKAAGGVSRFEFLESLLTDEIGTHNQKTVH
jgi:hypothetical protein